MRLLLAGDPDAWLILLAMTTISLFPLGLLWYAIRLMKVANRDTGQAEESIAAVGLQNLGRARGFVRMQRRETLKWSADLYVRADAA